MHLKSWKIPFSRDIGAVDSRGDKFDGSKEPHLMEYWCPTDWEELKESDIAKVLGHDQGAMAKAPAAVWKHFCKHHFSEVDGRNKTACQSHAFFF